MTRPVRVLANPAISPALLSELRRLLDDAFEGDFAGEDWEHTLGGWHVIATDGDAVVAHAAVVPRTIHVDDRPFRAGYIEGVATGPRLQRGGLGSTVMAEASRQVQELGFELGVLSTGLHEFYQRCGWERWRGPTFVRDGDELIRTEGEDDGIMVLRFGPSHELDLTAPISCDRRSGDDW